MSNQLYDHGREAFLADLDWLSGTFKACLVGAGYTPDLATDQFLSDIPGGEIIATSPTLTSPANTAGVASADNVTFAAVAGATADYIVIYEDTGSGATSRLVALIDTATGLPVIPNGGDIGIAWDTGADKIFKL